MSTGAPLPPNPMYPNVPPMPPPPNSGNTVLKIVLIVVGVFVLGGVAIACVIGYIGYKAIHRDNRGNLSISTPGGTITTGNSAALSAADLGTDPYPGAVSGEGSMNMKSPTGSMVTAVYTSPDAPDKIVAFYKEKLGDQASIAESSNGTVLSLGDRQKNSIMITVTPQGSASKIVIIHLSKSGGSQ